MDKKQIEIELKKIEVEKLKMLESYLRTLLISVLTLGAGIGTLSHWINVSKEWLFYLLVLLTLTFIVFSSIFISVLIRFNRRLKELEKWKL